MGEAAKKTGVDDFFAAGGTVAELLLRARPYEPQDTARERLSRDQKLRRAIEDLWAAHGAMPLKTIGQNTRAAVKRVLIEEAEKTGELVERDGREGVRIVLDRRTTAERSARSVRSVHKAVEALEDEGKGNLMRDNTGRRAEKAGAFVLFTGRELGNQYGKKGTAEEKETQEEERENAFSKATYTRGDYPTRPPSVEVPPLRWPKIIHYWEKRDGRRVVADSHYVWRLGEKRGQILRHILEAGELGTFVPETELMDRFAGARTKARDFRRWTLAPLTGWRYEKDPETKKLRRSPETGEVEKVSVGPPLVELVGVDGVRGVRALPGCLEALEEYRKNTDEIEDAERQRERHADQRRKFRERDKTQADKPGELKGKEHNRRTQERNSPHWERQRVEGQRQKVGTTCETFVHDTLARLGKVRFGLLRDMWAERGGKRDHIRFAIKALGYKMEPLPEHGNALFVFPVESSPPEPQKQPEAHEAEPAPVIPLVREPRKVESVHVHSPECLCDWCDDFPEPKYAKLVGAP